jgi:beta-lactam-binding protein with PASTA domain
VLKRSFLFNLLLVILVVIGLVFLFFSSLNFLTNHGKQTIIPKLEGKSMSEAVGILKSKGFRIVIDSTYQSYSKPLEVLYQEPEVGANVKIGRTVFITVNRKTPPSIPMPNLVNTSFRNAILTMQSYRLVMGDTTYKPDVAAGAVLEQWVNGRKIAPGTLVPIGSRIDLVIGEGLSEQIEVPNIIGMTWNEAKSLLDSKMLSINAIWEGEITDSAFAIIYNQQPEAINELDFNNQILAGDIIDVRIMQSPSQELLLKNQPGSKKLLGSSDEDTAEVTSSTEVQMPERPTGTINRDSIKKPRAILAPSPHKKEDNIKDNQDKIADRDNKKVNSNVIKKTGTPAKANPKKDTKESNIKHSGGISDEYQ